MALYHKWDVKNGFAYVLTFFSLISDILGSVNRKNTRISYTMQETAQHYTLFLFMAGMEGHLLVCIYKNQPSTSNIQN